MQRDVRRRSVLGGLAASALVAGQARADEVTFGAYDAFTLYNAEGPFLKDEVILLFHGFASAMPNGAYRGLYTAFSERFSIIGFNYDYFDLDRNDALMESAWTTLLMDRDVTFAGTSLGGFQANYYAERYSVPRAVLDGPYGKSATTAYSYRLNQSFAPRRDYEGDLSAIRQPLLVLAGADDESFVAERYEPVISASTQTGTYHVLPGVNHLGLVNDEKAIGIIASWLKRLPG